MILLEALYCGCKVITTINANVPSDLLDYVLIDEDKISQKKLYSLIDAKKWNVFEGKNKIIHEYKNNIWKKSGVKLTVIIAVKNEIDHIQNCLHPILGCL